MIKYRGDDIYKSIFEIVKEIWKNEQMPDQWRYGIIFPILKKGNFELCKNYRGITLLNTAYKILTPVIQKCLIKHTEQVIGPYQCEFCRGRSTVDTLHLINQIIETAYEYNIELYTAFIAFQTEFD